jgi:hypothetical protein
LFHPLVPFFCWWITHLRYRTHRYPWTSINMPKYSTPKHVPHIFQFLQQPSSIPIVFVDSTLTWITHWKNLTR